MLRGWVSTKLFPSTATVFLKYQIGVSYRSSTGNRFDSYCDIILQSVRNAVFSSYDMRNDEGLASSYLEGHVYSRATQS